MSWPSGWPKRDRQHQTEQPLQMRLRRFYGVCSVVSFLCLAASVNAQGANLAEQARAAIAAASERALQALQARSDGFWTASTNRDTGLPRMLIGGKSPSYGTSAVEAAQAFLEDNSDVFLPGNRAKPPAERIALKLVSARSLAGSTVVEFRAEYVGIPVDGASLSAQVDPSGRVALVTSSIDPRMPASTKPAKTFHEVDSALRATQAVKGVRVTPATNILVVLSGNTPRLAYQALYKVGTSGEPWEYLLDAESGEVLKAVRLVAEDAIGPPATASRQGIKREDSSASTGKDRRIATCRAHVDLTADREKGMGNPAASTPIATAYAARGVVIDSLVGGKDADGDGYYDTYQFRIGIYGDASLGPATVYARIICDTTGQRWRTGTWMVRGTVPDYQYFGFDETDFPEQFAGISALDFTVEIWSSGIATPSPRKAAGTGASARAGYAVTSGRTLVFDPNPANTLNGSSLADQNNSDTPVFSKAYVEVDLKWLDAPSPPSYQYQLIGRFARMEDIVIAGVHKEPPVNTPPVSTTPEFRYHRNDNAFEEVMCYYHVTRNQEYIQSLGFTDINNRPISIDAHGLNGDTNAYYMPTNFVLPRVVGIGYLTFGDGMVDAGEDADVILHEYGHSIQDYSAPSLYLQTNNGETRAMGEGFGDYWACSCTRAESLASGYDPACWAEWWMSWAPRLIRHADTDKVYPDDLTWNASDFGWHDNGEIWSACLWDILNALGKTTSDRIVLESHRQMRSIGIYPGFAEGADAIVAADQALYGGTHIAQIRSIFSARGIPDQPPRGTLQFGSPAYAVNENGGTVAITVTRAGGSFGKASVNYYTVDGSAMGGSDYMPRRGVLSWTNRDTASKTLTVPIMRDAILEGDETFAVSLSTSAASRVSLGSPSLATVTIGPPGTVQLSSATYSVSENGGTVTITATRTGGSFGTAGVYYTTASGSAAAGSDYASQSGLFAWGDGDMASKMFAVPIVDDAVYEGDETFTVSLYGGSGLDAGSPASATVTITDNDRALGTSVLPADTYPSVNINTNGRNHKNGGTSTEETKGRGTSTSRTNRKTNSGAVPEGGTPGGAGGVILPSGSTNAAWLFEEGRGDVVSDALIEGRTGVVHGAEWTTNTAASGSQFALEFHGSNDWVDLGRDADMMPSTGLTLSVWVNISSNSVAGAIVASCFRPGDGSNTTGYGIFQEDGSTGTVTCALGLQGATNDALLRVSVTNDTWQHVAMTYDRSSGLLRAYLNGQPAGERDVGSRDIAYTGSEVLAVGRHLAGCVDEVRVCDRALGPPGVSALYRGFPMLPFVH